VTLAAGTQIGKYVVGRRLAEGGMAEIYLCSVRGPEGFEKKIAVKRIRSLLAGDPDFVQMFIAEARLASLLNHPNIVQIFDFNKDEESYYLAMEYVRGQSLWSVHKRARELMIPVPTTLVAHIGAEVARGLHYAHRLSVKGQWLALVHRDVTPHNVLLSYDGVVKLTDFGIAKAAGGMTAPGKLKGKFAYMSPEQARGEAVDARSDIFALGIVLWELLTGGRLFDGDGDLAILRSVQHSIIPPPARLNPEVPPGLDAAVMRALERDPAQRYQSAQELERALAEHIFTQARGVEDTDLSAFLKRIFGVSQQQSHRGADRSGGSSIDELSDVPSALPATPRRAPGARRLSIGAPSKAWRWVFLLGMAMLAISTPVLLFHLRPGSASAVAASDPFAERPSAPVEASPAPLSADPLAAPGGIGADRSPTGAQPKPETSASADRKSMAKPHPLPTGMLVLQVTPWAHVFIDGKNQGEVTGVRRFRLRAGKHRLRFKHPRATEERTISLASNQELHQDYRVVGL
jgi:serine/threonine-protein kinase